MEVYPEKATEVGTAPAAVYNAGNLASCDVRMKPGYQSTDSAPTLPQEAGSELKLLITLAPWYRGLLGNFRDLFSAPESPPDSLSSSSAPFWPDVFVRSPLPWRRFAESAFLHGVSVLALWGVVRLRPPRPYRATPVVFSSADVLRYELSDYLPTLDTGVQSNAPAEKGDPANGPQAIISVPPNSENRRQTIVSPPALALNRDTPLPNIVAWTQPDPRIPPAVTAAQVSDLRQAGLPSSVVAPPPEVERNRIVPLPVLSQAVIAPAPDVGATLRTNDAPAPQSAIVRPPPEIEAASLDRWHDINVGRAQVVSPAPQLPVAAQRALPVQASLANSTTSVVPPPPRAEGTEISNQHGRLIALNVQPAAAAPVAAPNGNRRGSFAVDPQGKANGAGTPDIPDQRTRTSVSATKTFGSGQNMAGVPSGLFVGARPKAESTSTIGGEAEPSDSEPGSGDAGLMAKASVPRVTASELSADQQSEPERQVFGGRRSYAMTLNVPNLNSAGGSWVMHFAELEDGTPKGDLLAPVATRTVAPKYPLELMRENVAGTVMLSAVISSDGHVGQITVLTGTDDRLNEYARNALLGWRFMPALRNGKPVALQAVVKIPFKAMAKTGF
ncbi:MAG TPA: TonB family protein [Terriglobales bacterium]|nr:TonB family protein [Terriglobales bacterium]